MFSLDWMRDEFAPELVEKKRWISNRSFLHALSHCMILPLHEAQQLAIYIGLKLHGKPGSIVAEILFVLRSMFVLLALSVVYARFGSLPWIAALVNGLKVDSSRATRATAPRYPKPKAGRGARHASRARVVPVACPHGGRNTGCSKPLQNTTKLRFGCL